MLAHLGLENRQEVTLARLPAWFSSAKATRELGYEPAPIESALDRAVRTLDVAAHAEPGLRV